MEDKKVAKKNIGTTICVIIIVLLIIALSCMYYFGFIKHNRKISELENKIESIEKQNNKSEEKIQDNSNTKTNNKNDEGEEFNLIYNAVKKSLEEMKKNPKDNFIASDNKIEDIKILSIDIDRIKDLMGDNFPSDEYPEEYNDDNLIIGTVKYALKLDKTDGLQLAGSGDTEFIENWLVNNQLYIYNKTLNTVELATGL